MRIVVIRLLLAAALSNGLGAAAFADVLWNNMQGVNGYDGVAGLSSERNTLVSDSWAADDVIAGQAWQVTGIRWIGLRDDSRTYLRADYLVLDASLSVIADVRDVAYTATPKGRALGMEAYEGLIDVPNLALAPGRYYFATRLVDGALGRNFIATTGSGAMNGMTHSLFRSPFFGLNNWVSSSLVLDSGASELAYRIEGVGVPEPASAGLLLAGALALLRRR